MIVINALVADVCLACINKHGDAALAKKVSGNFSWKLISLMPDGTIPSRDAKNGFGTIKSQERFRLIVGEELFRYNQ